MGFGERWEPPAQGMQGWRDEQDTAVGSWQGSVPGQHLPWAQTALGEQGGSRFPTELSFATQTAAASGDLFIFCFLLDEILWLNVL